MTAGAGRRRRLPIRTRLAISIGVVVALVTISAFAGADLIVRRELYGSLDNTLVRAATELQLAANQRSASAASSFTSSSQCQYLAAPACSQLVAADGSTDGILPAGAGEEAVARGTRKAYFSNTNVAGLPVRAYVAPLRPGFAVQVGLRSDGTARSLSRLRTVLLLLSGIGVLLSAALGYLVARGGLRPLRALTAAAERIATERDLRYQITLPGNDEPARLAAAFNAMLTELAASLEAQQQLITDASHELRTPLASIQANAELQVDPRLPASDRERVGTALTDGIKKLTALVGDVLDLARGAELPHEPEAIELATLVAGCVADATRHWPDARFSSELSPAPTVGSPRRLERLVTNLLDNAAKFSPRSGVVEVSVYHQGGRSTVTIRDHGPGIAPADLPHIFSRFYRAPEARALPGSGLGLSIAQQIASAHRATIRAANADTGGLVVEVEFNDEVALGRQ